MPQIYINSYKLRLPPADQPFIEHKLDLPLSFSPTRILIEDSTEEGETPRLELFTLESPDNQSYPERFIIVRGKTDIVPITGQDPWIPLDTVRPGDGFYYTIYMHEPHAETMARQRQQAQMYKQMTAMGLTPPGMGGGPGGGLILPG